MKVSQQGPEFQPITIVCETEAEWMEVSNAVFARTQGCYKHTLRDDIKKAFVAVEQKQ